MTAPELLDRILALPIGVSGAFRSCPKERNRWHLVQALLNSIQAETTGANGDRDRESVLAESGFSDYLSNLQDYEERLACGEIQW
ncbi:hypothetical protein PJF56_19765 [Roseofilum sp. BLCC_M91]|uniref:Uncharacterized protein n=1 Tax=Roseofilum halophilum BLCC-M91 TaxID=3022259 RepID=A0ABT7BQT0_9CYAN|nr:hypothetical protein [Roseofilum halophilum]MDJ1181102.1 hypothetical protein [Roseofilum halophilum BLCC-M91]